MIQQPSLSMDTFKLKAERLAQEFTISCDYQQFVQSLQDLGDNSLYNDTLTQILFRNSLEIRDC